MQWELNLRDAEGPAPTLVLTPDDIACPVHRACIGPFLARASMNLAMRRSMRCVCWNYWCLRHQVELEAWHLYWAQTDHRGHDAGDEERNDYRWAARYL